MPVLDALNEAAALLFTIEHLLFLGIGVLLGLAVGVFPGLGGIAGLSLVLPFLYGLDPVSGLAMMVGLVAVIPTSDTFTSVLMGIPGSSGSQATVVDGFPLARQGQAARALSAAFASSLFGGLFGALVLTAFILIARPIVLTFRTPELLMLTILGLSMVGVLAGRSLFKGFGAAGLGMLVGSIGLAPAQGSPRMTFDTLYLGDGLQLVIVGLGIFAIPEIVNLLRRDRSISETATLGAGWLQGLKDWWRNLWLSLRCSVLGVIVGAIPGLGGSVVDWIAYGHTVQTTRERRDFGKGEIRGVIGPESSNNAKEGGGLVPTLLFGIPGSGSMAVFLGGMALIGIQPGPTMIELHLGTTYTIVWSLALANVLGAGLCIVLAGLIARLTTIRFAILAPFMFMLIVFAAFQAKTSLWDLVALLAIGVLGLYMKRFDWPRPTFLIGFVLAAQAEVYTYQATQFTQLRGMSYLLTPAVGIIALVTIVSVWLGARQSEQLAQAETPAVASAPVERWPQVVFAAVVVAYAAFAAWDAVQLGVLIDKVFPLAVALMVLFMALFVLVQTMTAPKDHPVLYDDEVLGDDARDPERRTILHTLLWLVGLVLSTALVGFIIANTLFFLLFLRVRAGLSWTATVFLTVCADLAVMLFARVLYRDFPAGLLQQYMDLPWPLR